MGKWKVTVDERFRRKYRVDPNGCWIWTGATDNFGYGHFWNGEGYSVAHRWSWEQANGRQADLDKEIDHLCRNPPCVNPNHLEEVTAQTNVLRGESFAAKNAVKTHCPRSHPYNAVNTYIWGGSRMCKICRRDRKRENYQALAAARTTNHSL